MVIDEKCCSLSCIKKEQNVIIAINFDDPQEYWVSGIVKSISQNQEPYDENGIKVRIHTGQIGHVKKISDFDILTDAQIRKMLQDGETLHVEFKESFQVASPENIKLKCLRNEIPKEIGAFMNSAGGTLLIGINDLGSIVGLDRDYVFIEPERDTQTKQDKLKQEIHSYVKTKLDDVNLESDYNVMIKEIDGHEIAVIQIKPSSKPVFVNVSVKYMKCGTEKFLNDEKPIFYIRTDSGTDKLNVRDIFEYWKKK